jgi:outer membrane protein assembly factor BamB
MVNGGAVKPCILRSLPCNGRKLQDYPCKSESSDRAIAFIRRKTMILLYGRLKMLILFVFLLCCVAGGPAWALPGVEKWAFAAGGEIYSSPAIGKDGTIYFGSWDKNLYAVKRDGSLKWAFPTGDIVWSSPAVAADGTIYAGSSDKNLYAVNPDGTQKWAFLAGGAVDSSPAVAADGTIYVGSDDGNLYAVNPANGSQKWAFTTLGAISRYASPAVDLDGTIYVGSDDGNLYAVNPANGSQKWAFPIGNHVYASAIGPDGTIYVGSFDFKLYAVNPNGTQKWAFTTGGPIYFSPSIGSDGTIYVGSYDHSLYAVNPDGTKKWSFPTGFWIESTPAIGSDGTIYFGSADSKIYAVDPDGTEKWAFATHGLVVSGPAIGKDGTIYMGSYDSNLYALTSSSKGLAASTWPMFHQNITHGGVVQMARLEEGTVTGSPTTVAWGSKLTVTDRVSNTGNIKSVSSTTSYYLSPSSGAGILVGQKKLSPLAAGGAVNRAATFSISGSVATGSYDVYVCPTRSMDDCQGGSTIQVTAPNLVEVIVSFTPATVARGGTLLVGDTTANQGDAGAKASTTRFYLAAGATKHDAYLIGSRSVGALAPSAQSSSVNVKAKVPKTIPAGAYYVLACADDKYLVPESNETDNCIASLSQVTVTNP